MVSYWLTTDTYGLSVTVFELFGWLQNRFRPSVRPGYDDKYRPRSYSFVERQKSLLHYTQRDTACTYGCAICPNQTEWRQQYARLKCLFKD